MADATDYERAVSVLCSGGVIVYPTESVFGLGCDPDSTSALRKVLSIKKRPENKGMLVVCHDFALVSGYVDLEKISDDEMEFALKCWEDFCTLAMPASQKVHPLLKGAYPTVAVRISRHPAVAELCSRFKKPIVSTSANLSGAEPVRTAAEAETLFNGAADYILKGMTLGYERPSRIIDLKTRKIMRN